MDEVRKYKVPASRLDEGVVLPEGAAILHIDIQGSVWIWALVDPSRASSPTRWIAYYATGEPIPDNARYHGTALTPDRQYVWHVFEKANRG